MKYVIEEKFDLDGDKIFNVYKYHNDPYCTVELLRTKTSFEEAKMYLDKYIKFLLPGIVVYEEDV